MISIISRKYGGGKECKLSVRVSTPTMNNAFALGIGVDEYRWLSINGALKSARTAYKRGGSVFIDDSLTSKLWQLMRTLMIQERAGTLCTESITIAINENLHKESLEEFTKEVNIQKQKKDILRQIQKPTLIEFIEQYCHESKSGIRLSKGKTTRHAKGTHGVLSSLLVLLKRYIAEKKTSIDWDDVNIMLFSDLKKYMVENNYANNTISVYMSSFKTILLAAKEARLTTTDDFMSSSWNVKLEAVDNVYLTQERIEMLYTTDFSNPGNINTLVTKAQLTAEEKQTIETYTNNQRQRNVLCRARDIFIMGCITGQRVSDYKRINTSMLTTISNKEFLRITQQKTKTEVYIPLSARMSEILQRYNGELPSMQEQDLIKRIRICALILGWTEDAGITEHKGIERTQTGKKFYECIKTHTARRSFATNAYKNGVPLSAIMAVTGHSSEQMLRKYLKLDNKERGIMAAKAFEKLGYFE